ncbi:ArsR family transcriptional regulator [Halovenus marina]|uniref:ArsR family transcriptional regulator n=1 Tax=Halovenus marina TaxID=3396621 RepID=UPI003F573D0D
MNDFDEIMRALSNGRRRQILVSLCDDEYVHPFSGDGDAQEKAIQLRHVHLPFLEENDLIEWKRDTGTVTTGDDFEVVEPVLTALETQRDALPDDYLPTEGQTW